MAMDAAFAELLSWYEQHAPKHVESLRPPASESELQAAEAATGTTWHPSVLAWFALHDGATLNSLGILPSHRLLPLAEALSDRAMFLEVEDGIDWEGGDDDDFQTPDSHDVDEDSEEDVAVELIEIETDPSESDTIEWQVIEHSFWSTSIDEEALANLRARPQEEGGPTPEAWIRTLGSDDDSDEIHDETGDGSRFEAHFLPFAAWDDDVLVFDLNTGEVSGFETVEGIYAYRRWHDSSAMLEWLLSSLRNGHGFLLNERPTIAGGEVEWEYEG